MSIKKIISAVFRYETDTQSGGHSGFFEYNPEIELGELVTALEFVGANAYIDNLKIAWERGEFHDHFDTDKTFGTTQPRLVDILQEFVVSNANDLIPGVHAKTREEKQ